jgi:hypothetical protein
VKTEEFQAAPKLRTEQMPALKRGSRKLEPLPVQEPSVIVRPSMQPLPDMTAPSRSTSETELSRTEPPSVVVADQLAEPVMPPPKSNGPLIAVLGLLVVVLLGAVGFVMSRPPPAETPTEEAPVAVAEAIPLPGTPDLPTPTEDLNDTPAVVDAGPVTPPPLKPRLTVDPPPPVLVRKGGFLTVKAVPFATVIVQGKAYEVTGVKKIPAPVGTYDVVLKHPKKSTKERVTVKADEATSVSFSAE